MKSRFLKRVLSVCLTFGLLMVSTTLMSNACWCDGGPGTGTCSYYNAPGYPYISQVYDEEEQEWKCFLNESTVYYFMCGLGGDNGICNQQLACGSVTPVPCP
jgi:hypothetical protein